MHIIDHHILSGYLYMNKYIIIVCFITNITYTIQLFMTEHINYMFITNNVIYVYSTKLSRKSGNMANI